MPKTFYPLILTGGINEDDNKGTLYDTLKNKILFFRDLWKAKRDLYQNAISKNIINQLINLLLSLRHLEFGKE